MRITREYGRRISQGLTSADVALEPRLPYPAGWSAVAFSEELGTGAVLTRPLMGQDVVLYRPRTGEVRAIRPFCPHLGAHLGLGSVEGNDLVCPFHNFAFGPDGSCVRTAYDAPPPKVSLTQLPVREVNGAIFVWRHHDGRQPDWEIPAFHSLGHLRPHSATWEMAGHAQEVIENSVDLGHFAVLHDLTNAELGAPVAYDGVTFHVSMRALGEFSVLGRHQIEIEVDGYGLSCLHTDIRTPGMGLELCTKIMATMIAPNRMQFRQSTRFAVTEPSRLPPRLARLVSRSLARLLARPMFRFSCEFTAVDFPIWDTKEYRMPPGLAKGDGPIGPFRHWAQQFYPPPPGARTPPGSNGTRTPAESNGTPTPPGSNGTRTPLVIPGEQPPPE
ncbi:Rieske 2Fe-2S domain-containing protein [Streptomyces sp. P1-3]|uniref:Rieske 2Fe-2S domain-containing protein n=1 Tax=Streptomyces sp. P1-3 TaxID=3421658 RepID=UPI003D36D963